MKKRVGEPKKLHCPDHPYYHGERKPVYTCEQCMAIWEHVNAQEERYFEEMRRRTLPGDKERRA